MGAWQVGRLSTLVSLLLFYLIPVLGGLAVYLALPGERGVLAPRVRAGLHPRTPITPEAMNAA